MELNGAKAPNGNRDGETNNGDLITDAMLWKVMQNKEGLTVNEDHVVAITNGGGIRAAIKVGENYNEISADAGSKVIEDSEIDTSAKGDNRVVVKINHATKAKGAYPIVLVSYDVACLAYKDANTAKFVKSWLTYVTSDEGQKTASSAAGSAPLPSNIVEKVTKSIEAIKTK